ncbi:barstar family protein [Bdellovibrio sp.]|uniref:barstar family protein n=1 Tax=Bdellovibrio sp. TaxID=28201 RepID=UPI0039E5E3D5
MKILFGLLAFCAALLSYPTKSYADMFSAAPTLEQRDIKGATIFESEEVVMLMIDGSAIESTKHLHEIFAEALKLPTSYGKNLDALFDVLTDQTLISKKIDITIRNGSALTVTLGEDTVDALLEVLNSAQEADPNHMSLMYWQ